MEEKIVIVKEDGTPDTMVNIKAKVKEQAKIFAGAVRRTASEGWRWFKENKEDAILLATTIAGAAGVITKLKKKPATESERDRIDTTYYDPSTGAHWRLKRPMTNCERIELVQRKRNGEYAEEILDDMRILK